MRLWRSGLALGLGVLTLHLILPSHPVVQVLAVAGVVGSCGAAVVGPRRRPGGRSRHRGWLVVATGMVLMAVAARLPSVAALLAWEQPWVEALGWSAGLLGPPLLLIGSWVVLRAVGGGRDWDSVIDAAVVGIAMSAALWRFVWAPMDAADVPTALLPLLVVVVFGPVATVAVTLRLLFHRPRLPAVWLLQAATVSLVIGNAMAVAQVGDRADAATQAVWLAAFVCGGAALSHPSIRRLPGSPHPAGYGFDHQPRGRLAVLGAGLLVAQSAAAWRSDVGAALVPLVGALVATLLVLWRFERLLRARAQAQAAAGLRAREQAAVASLGQRATASGPSDDLVRAALRVLGDVLPEHAAAIVPASDAPPSPDDGALRIGVGELDGVSSTLVVHPGGAPFDKAARRFVHTVASVLHGGLRWRALHGAAVHRSLHDPLTGLPNRRLLLDRLEHLLLSRDGTGVAVLFIDLDRFKHVNDTLGHDAGDALLREVADRLCTAVRAGDVVGRQAGDEFVVLCPATDEVEARHVAARIDAALRPPWRMAHGQVDVGASIGIAFTPPGGDAEAVLRAADRAMYVEKQRGRSDAAAVPA